MKEKKKLKRGHFPSLVSVQAPASVRAPEFSRSPANIENPAPAPAGTLGGGQLPPKPNACHPSDTNYTRFFDYTPEKAKIVLFALQDPRKMTFEPNGSASSTPLTFFVLSCL